MKLTTFAAFGFTLALLCSIVRAQPPEARPAQPTPGIVVPPPLGPEEEVELIVAGFADVVFTSDGLEQAARCVEGAQTGEALQKAAAEFKKARGTWEVSVRVTETHIHGDIASVKLRLRLTDTLFNRISHDEKLTLRRANNSWKIVPLTREQLHRNRAGVDETDILLNLATLLVFPDELLESKAHEAHECMNNLKHLGVAAMMFLQDWDEKFALKADKYREALLPYSRNERIFQCRDAEKGTLNYTFNKNLENVTLDRLQNPMQTVMFYEGKDGNLEFRHDNRAAVAFADGHVELVTPERAKTLKWLP